MDEAEPGTGTTRHRAAAGGSPFERFADADVRALIEAYPLAWVCAGGGAAMEASLLPLIGQFDGEGRLVELIGHLARSNPLHAALRRDPQAAILFQGPQAYVSPEHAGRRDWAPTWNYAQLHVDAEIMFDEALTEPSLTVLIEAMEAGRPQPWNASELGPRYHDMLPHIIGFRAPVSGLTGRFKLGQDEDAATLAHILATLGDHPVMGWMRRFNPQR